MVAVRHLIHFKYNFYTLVPRNQLNRSLLHLNIYKDKKEQIINDSQ